MNDPSDKPVVLSRDEHPISRKDIDPDALKIIYRLNGLGFTAYLCGGAVRDLMLGRKPKDFDVATDARPGQIKKRFGNAFIIGRRFRLAHVRFYGGKIIEVATFRRDPNPGEEEPSEPIEGDADPKGVYGTPRDDAFRRDITINALYYDPHSFSVIDYVGGLDDLARKRIRVIGDPGERFTEDPVRVWRVLRHAARLGFAIEEATERAIHTHGSLLAGSPGSRLYEELNKDLCYETKPVIEILRSYRLLRYILGRAGEEYEADYGKFSRLSALLDIEDHARSEGLMVTLEEMYTLVFWPWLEDVIEESGEDMHAVLLGAFAGAGMQAVIPKSLRADIIQIMIILWHMRHAMTTGRMRWGLRKRAHFPQASRLLVMMEKERAPKDDESFESLFVRAHPSAPRGSDHGRRRYHRRGPRRNPDKGPGLNS
jgi:poly(A) polymerase